MDLRDVIKNQEEFNKRLNDGMDRAKEEIINNLLVSLFVEVGEFANEVPYFKYWKNTKIDYNKMVEEYADILLIWVSLGIEIGLEKEEIFKAIKEKILKNNERQNNGY